MKNFRHKGFRLFFRSSYTWGHFVEKYIAFCLRFKGYTPISRNVMFHKGTGLSEIDLICRKGTYIILFEIKCRATLREAGEAIGSLDRLKRSATFIAARFPDKDIRTDAVLVNRFLCFRHLKNIGLF